MMLSQIFYPIINHLLSNNQSTLGSYRRRRPWCQVVISFGLGNEIYDYLATSEYRMILLLCIREENNGFSAIRRQFSTQDRSLLLLPSNKSYYLQYYGRD